MHRDTFASFVATWIIMLLLALILLTGKPISPAAVAPPVTNIYKKYYVKPPEPAEEPPIELEGDYSSYAVYDSFEDADVYILGDFGQYAIGNQKETLFILIDGQNNKIKRYDITTKTLTDLGVTDPIIYYGVPHRTDASYGTYFVVVDDYDSVDIIKDGVVLQTLTYADLGFTTNEIRTASISPSAKYIAISGKLSATGTAGWVILVGS